MDDDGCCAETTVEFDLERWVRGRHVGDLSLERSEHDARTAGRSITRLDHLYQTGIDASCESGCGDGLIDQTPLDCFVTLDPLLDGREDIGEIATDESLVDETGETTRAGEHGEKWCLGKGHRGGSIVDEDDAVRCEAGDLPNDGEMPVPVVIRLGAELHIHRVIVPAGWMPRRGASDMFSTSNTEVFRPRLVVCEQFGGCPPIGNRALRHDVHPIRDAGSHGNVLLDEQDR